MHWEEEEWEVSALVLSAHSFYVADGRARIANVLNAVSLCSCLLGRVLSLGAHILVVIRETYINSPWVCTRCECPPYPPFLPLAER